ncbi:MAG: hypothetical protein AAGJ18_24445, partial [Bacteroidota bacterium]
MSTLKDNFDQKKNALGKAYDDKKKEIQDDIAATKTSIGKGVEKGKKAVSSFFKKLLWTILILGILTGVGYLIFANMNYSVGSRAGELIKISEKGVVFKTYEGQLSLGGLTMTNTGSDANIGNVWEFSVTDKAVFEQMDQLRGKKVILTYKEKYRTLPWRGDTKYLVT